MKKLNQEIMANDRAINYEGCCDNPQVISAPIQRGEKFGSEFNCQNCGSNHIDFDDI